MSAPRCRVLFGLLAPALSVVGQSVPLSEALVQRATAFGYGGSVRRITICEAQACALTQGSFGDLVCWDLGTIEPRWSIAADRGIRDLDVHPGGTWLAATARSAAGVDEVVRIRILDGAVTSLLPGRFAGVKFDDSGKRLALWRNGVGDGGHELVVHRLDGHGADRGPLWRTAGARRVRGVTFAADGSLEVQRGYTRESTARSANGKHQLERGNHEVSIDGQRWAVPGQSMSPYAAAVTDTGTAWICDRIGRLWIVTAASREPGGPAPVARGGHRSRVVALRFSPDSKRLALVGFGGVRCVDLDGRERARLDGAHLVAAGGVGPELHVLTGREGWTIEATSGRRIGVDRRWQGFAAALRYENPAALSPRETWRCEGFAVAPSGTWWFARDTGALIAVDGVGGTMRIVDAAVGGAVLLTVLQGSGDVLACRNGRSGDRLSRWNESGEECASLQLREPARWCLVDEARGRVWVGVDRGVVLLGLDDLRRREVLRTQHQLFEAALMPSGGLLASVGQQLVELAPTDLSVVRRWLLPAGLGSIELLRVSPDGEHLAVVAGAEVRILQLP